MCSDGFKIDEEPDGECPECGEETYQGEATSGCYWSKPCETCGGSLCEGAC